MNKRNYYNKISKIFKKYFFILKKPKIAIPFIITILILLPIFSHLASNILENKFPNRAEDFRKIAYYTSFGLLGNKNHESSVDNTEKNTIVENLIVVDPSLIEIKGQRVIKHYSEEDGRKDYCFSALLKNNSEFGIPEIVFPKITIYDEKDNIIGEKTDYKTTFSLVLNGEMPFSYCLFEVKEDFNPSSFRVGIEIPEFRINKEVVRLEIVKNKIINKDFGTGSLCEGYASWSVALKGPVNFPMPAECNKKVPMVYEYEITLRNPYPQKVENISYIGFLKSKDSTLTRSETAGINFVQIPIEKPSTSLNELQTKDYLDSGEEGTIIVKLLPDPLLFRNDITNEDVEAIFYFIGLLSK